MAVMAALLIGVVCPQVALGAITIGPDVNAVSNSSIGCSLETQSATCSNATLTGGAFVTSPIDGVVVRWRVKVSNGTSTATFRILRAVSSGVFTGAGSSSPSPPFGAVGDFPTRLPIQEGDRIGVDLPPFLGPCAQGCLSTISGGSMDIWRPPLADGASPGLSPTSTSSNTALINANVEADADADSFGDETQDKCPGAAGTEEGCFLINPTPLLPQVKLGGPRKQKALAQGAVIVFVTSSQAGSASATATINLPGGAKIGALTPASSALAPNAETRLKLKLPKAVRVATRKALKDNKKPKAKVAVNVTTPNASLAAKRTIQIKGQKAKKSG